MKNPTVLQDDFWTIFINLWIFIFNFLTQIVYAMWPGRNFYAINLCIGKISYQLLKQDVKRIYMQIIIGFFSLILHVGFFISSKLLKYYSAKKYNEFREFENKWSNVLTKENLFSLASQLLSVIYLFVVLFYIPEVVNRSYLAKFDQYPNYLLIYFQDLVLTSTSITLLVSLAFKRNPKLKNSFWKDILALLRILKCLKLKFPLK